MPTIQTDVSDEALVTAIRANLNDFYRHIGRSKPENYFEDENFARWITPLPHSWFNGILCMNPPVDGDEAFIKESIDYFRGKRVHAFTCWMEPRLTRADWEPTLKRFGFRFDAGTPGMAVDLTALNESLQPVSNFEVRVAADEESIGTWSHIFTQGYGIPVDWESLVFEVWKTLGVDFPLRSYIGYLNGEPVATSALFFGGGVAGIYSVSTQPTVRGKGIGAAITLKPLQDAREMGYRIGTLQSSTMGFNIYKKLGFRHLCQVENFYRSIG